MTKGSMYILECSDGSYYTGSTRDLPRRLAQHQGGEGANYTRKRLPVKLVFQEEFSRIDEAYQREKQVQGWSRKKKQALINGEFNRLPELSRNALRQAQRTGGPIQTQSENPHASPSPSPELVEGRSRREESKGTCRRELF